MKKPNGFLDGLTKTLAFAPSPANLTRMSQALGRAQRSYDDGFLSDGMAIRGDWLIVESEIAKSTNKELRQLDLFPTS